MSLTPVIRPHTNTPVNTPNHTPRGVPGEALSAALLTAGDGAHRVGGGFETNGIAKGLESQRVEDYQRFRNMDDTAVNTTLRDYLDVRAQPHEGAAPAAVLMNRNTRDANFVTCYEQSYHDWHDRHTISSSKKTRGRPQSALGASNRSASAGGKRPMSSSFSVLKGSTVYKNTAPNNVKGLFVAYSDNQTEQQLQNMERDMENTRLQRETDLYNYRTELAKFLRENEALRAENAEQERRIQQMSEDHGRELHEKQVLKDEYENRYRTQIEENKVMNERMNAAERKTEEMQHMQGGLTYKIQTLEQQLLGARISTQQAEQQAAEASRRAGIIWQEKEVLLQKCKDVEAERDMQKRNVDTRDEVIRALENELREANEKLSSVAFFKDVLNKPRKSSKLYDKYYGQRQAAAVAAAGVVTAGGHQPGAAK